MIEDKKIYFTEGTLSNKPENQEDLKFLIDKELAEDKEGFIESHFVGKIVTPNNTYYSLPKNFRDENQSNLIDLMLEKYKSDSTQINSKYTLSKNSGYFESEKLMFKRLQKYFTDFITYEFIYPRKTIKKHSMTPISGGSIDMLATARNSKIYGGGFSYELKDLKNNFDWKLDDIYYHTVKELSDKYGTSQEINEIRKMKNFLDENGYGIEPLEKSLPNFTTEKIISEIKKCDVGIIHNPIKTTLLDYYIGKKLDTSSIEVKGYFTKYFQFVWEKMIRDALKHDLKEIYFTKEYKQRFKDTNTKGEWFSTSKEMEDFGKENPRLSNFRTDEEQVKKGHKGFYILFDEDDSGPDLFSFDNGFAFIGDAKYYDEKSDTEFEKEYSRYNAIQDNKYPMVVFKPSNQTTIPRNGYKRGRNPGDNRELIIIEVSVVDIIRDVISGNHKVLEKVKQLISKRTNRKFKF
jgi:hypothetical protein